MSGHTFPGRHGANPFKDGQSLWTGKSSSGKSSSGNPSTGSETKPPANPISKVVEEDENENDAVTSPTTARFGSNYSSGGAFGGDAAKDSQGPPPSFKPSSDGFPSNYGMGRRTSVSAESMNPTDSSCDKWVPPFHKKTPDQLARLRTAIGEHTLFKSLDDEQAHQIIGALVEKPIPAKNIKVISQGDQGDFFYIVESGSFDVYIHPSGSLQPGPDGLGTKVATISVGGTFGELALMYGAPRNATVVSAEPQCTLWALDRVTFRRILMDYTFARRRMYEKFLAEVPLLGDLNDYERSKIADALESIKFPAGATVIAEGDKGEAFYLLESGEAEAFKEGVEGPVKSYAKGDYFGELALLNDKPRAASVVCKTDARVARLGKDGFQRLLGPVEGIMRRERYEGVETMDPLSKS